MGRKGVTLVIEQVMLFMIGIMIFMACFAMFRSYEVYYTGSIGDSHTEEVSEWVVSTLIGLSERDDVNSTIKVTVPRYLGNEPYEIRLSQGGLNITTFVSGKSLFSPL